jgi:hypothetical protein
VWLMAEALTRCHLQLERVVTNLLNSIGGAIVISIPFFFVLSPFIIISLMIIFAGKPSK